MKYTVKAETKYFVRYDYSDVATFSSETEAIKAAAAMNQAFEEGVAKGKREAEKEVFANRDNT
jgi:hypothetical protein